MATQVKQSTFDDLIESIEPVRVKDGWYHHDMIFVEYGSGYAVADNGATVCLGEMPSIELYFKYGINKGLTPLATEILDSIKNMEEQIGRESVNTINTKLRTPDTKQRNHQRVRLSGNDRNNSKNFKPVKVRAKLSLHKNRSKQ